jgi:serine protease inhibitor
MKKFDDLIARQNNNIVFSPYSLASILYLTVLGSSGETRSQIEKKLKLPQDVSLESMVKETNNLLFGSPDVKLSLATR